MCRYAQCYVAIMPVDNAMHCAVALWHLCPRVAASAINNYAQGVVFAVEVACGRLVGVQCRCIGLAPIFASLLLDYV